MSAPAAGHDLRCEHMNGADTSVPCTCARGASVLRLPAGRARVCSFCGGPPAFQVGPDDRACETHVGAVLTHYFETTWDGWMPATVAPIRTPGVTR